MPAQFADQFPACPDVYQVGRPAILIAISFPRFGVLFFQAEDGIRGRDRHLDPRGSPSCIFLRPREPPIRPSPNLDGLLRLQRTRVSDRRRFRERRGGPGPFLDARLRRVHHISGALLLRFRGEPPTAPRGGVRPHLRVPVARRVPRILRRWEPRGIVPDFRRFRVHGTVLLPRFPGARGIRLPSRHPNTDPRFSQRSGWGDSRSLSAHSNGFGTERNRATMPSATPRIAGSTLARSENSSRWRFTRTNNSSVKKPAPDPIRIRTRPSRTRSFQIR